MNFALFLFLSLLLFFVSVVGITLNRKNILTVIMSLEMALLSVNLNFLIAAVHLDDRIGELIPIFVLAIAAAESSVGLAILINYCRIRGSICLQFVSQLKG